VAVFGELARIPGPGHRQQAHAVRGRHRETAEILRLADRSDEDDDLALDARAGERGLEALGEFRLADAGEPGDVHRNPRLQADRDELDEVLESHGLCEVSPGIGPRH
jgi:hypothetical protein